jgi:hypothetical protein
MDRTAILTCVLETRLAHEPLKRRPWPMGITTELVKAVTAA